MNRIEVVGSLCGSRGVPMGPSTQLGTWKGRRRWGCAYWTCVKCQHYFGLCVKFVRWFQVDGCSTHTVQSWRVTIIHLSHTFLSLALLPLHFHSVMQSLTLVAQRLTAVSRLLTYSQSLFQALSFSHRRLIVHCIAVTCYHVLSPREQQSFTPVFTLS